MLLDASADVAARDEERQTPLHRAAWRGGVLALCRLLSPPAGKSTIERGNVCEAPDKKNFDTGNVVQGIVEQ